MNLRFLIAGLMLMSLSVADAANTALAPPAIRISPRSPASALPPPSKSWFREKYLLGSYEIYYDYNLNRFELSDNDRDMCPDVYKSATIYAITGRYLQEIKHTCSSLYVQLPTKDNDSHIDEIHPPSFELQDLQIIYSVSRDVVQFLGQILCYTFEIVMTILSIVFAGCFTLILVILVFCQY